MRYCLCWVLLMLTVTFKPFLLIAIMLSAVMLSEVMLSVVMLSVLTLSVLMLSVIILNVVVLSVLILSVIILNVVVLSVFILSVTMLSVLAPQSMLYKQPTLLHTSSILKPIFKNAMVCAQPKICRANSFQPNDIKPIFD